MAKEREGSELSRIYEDKGTAEVALYGDAHSFIGQDFWIAKQLEGASKILDIGCGKGRMAKLLDGELYGVDISSTFVDVALKHGYADAKVCDVSSEEIPFADSFFDAAICLDILEHLVDPIHALAEINRVLKPEGLLGITTPNIAFVISRLALLLGHHTDTWEIAIPPPHLRYYTFNSLGKLLKQAGFGTVRIGGYPIEDWKQRKAELWRYFLWFLARLRPQLFAREIVLLAQKKRKPEQKQWQSPPVGSIKGFNRLKNLWRIT
ncbi:Ubiquinone biosynthesis O-methyltransferase [subsurface metagenome]